MNRKNGIITGDFNSNMLGNSGNGKKFKDLLQLTGFNNIIKSPIRVTENSSTVICTNNPTKIISSGVIHICIADHKFIYSSFKLIKSRNPPPIIKDVKSYKGMKENPKPFQDVLKSVPWWICSIFEDVDDIVWVWENLFNDVVNCHVPTRRVRPRQRSFPWMNSEIRKAMNKRYKLLRLCDGSKASKKKWEDYKRARNNVTKLLRSVETQYWKDH